MGLQLCFENLDPNHPDDKKESVSMKAFVMKSLDTIGFVDKPVPKPGPNDVVIKTTAALICTADSHTAYGGIGPRQNLTLGTKP